jgi:5-methylcytosine-specific restriction endonuclease McrA
VPASPTVPIGQIAGAVWSGVWSMVTHSPWIGVVLALVAVTSLGRFGRSVIHSGPKDPVRRFSRADKAVILFRAGGRCEYHGSLFGRCRVTEGLEADHVHPHSRGGWTRISNGQALCKRHNRQKRATVPFDIQLRSLEKRRLGYFPEGTSGSIMRHEAHRRRADR